MIYGYCRISTAKQSMSRQIRNIAARFPDAKIIEEVYTGTTLQRPKFDRLLKQLKKGDTIVFDEVSRMSRNAEEGYELYKDLYAKDINLVFLKEPQISTERYRDSMKKQISKVQTGNAITDKLLAAITDALQEYTMDLARQQIADAFSRSQAEVDYLHERTREGIESARLAGKQIGRQVGTHIETKRGKACKEAMLKMAKDFGGTMKDVEVIQILGCGRHSYYKWKKELKEATLFMDTVK